MSTIPFTTEGVDLASYDNLISCKSNVGEIKLTASSTQIDYNEFDEIGIIILNFFRYFHIFCSSDMDNDEELITTQYLNRTYEPGNGIIQGRSQGMCKGCPGTLLGVLLLFEIFAILPVAVATAERSFCTMKRIKTTL